MANSYYSNPIVLDTFTSEIDLGVILAKNTYQPFFVKYIEWNSSAGGSSQSATVTDGKGNIIFTATSSTANITVTKSMDNAVVYGIKVASGGVTSGKIVIHLL